MSCKHTPSPAGYVAWHLWAERKSKKFRQIKCLNCGLFAVWILKEKETKITFKEERMALIEENKALKESRDRLLVASIKFNQRVLELMPHINDDRAFAFNHGIEWLHGNWKVERENLEVAIKKAKALKIK